MVDFNKPVMTRDGRKVKVLATDLDGDYPVVGIVESDDHSFEGYNSENWMKSGQYSYTGGLPFMDLVNVQEKKNGYINLYRVDFGNQNFVIPSNMVYESFEKAKNGISEPQQYITTIQIEWVE